MTESIAAEFEAFDERFAGVGGDERIERIHHGCRWAEGPAYVAAGRYLVWSDIPNDRMLRWDEMTGNVGPFRAPAGYTNGHTLDRQGRLVSCEHGNRRVTRTEHDGSVTVLADSWQGKRLNSPNDVVVRSDDSVWFTDPRYGILSDYEGHRAESEIGNDQVYRLDPATGEVTAVADDFARPNGLAFSPDESLLYVADTQRKHLRVFDVRGDALENGRVLLECSAGGIDGIRLDTTGRIWAATHEGLHCFAPDGTLIGRLRLPEKTSNLVFGGLKRNWLFMTASTSVYAIMTNVRGA
ncbi:SMP-30/gluconolactonase/LRE family protein [Streptosporangium sp. NPDC002721]|uniref:SMP-30/gluconolactonase/LRE family protein n=1 Tax=Streptosporangium sp. NPDC002721 TaxID=3366188 RepID=UPI00369078C5